MSNREKGVFSSQLKVNPRGGSSSSFDPNDVQKVKAMISLWLGKRVDTIVGEQNENDFHSPSSSLSYLQCDDMLPSLIVQILSKEADKPKESESIDDSTSPRDSPTPSICVSKPPPLFPNRLKGKKV